MGAGGGLRPPIPAVPVLLAFKRRDSALAKGRSPGEGTGEREFWPQREWPVLCPPAAEPARNWRGSGRCSGQRKDLVTVKVAP